MIETLLATELVILLSSFAVVCLLFPSIRTQFLGVFILLYEQAQGVRQLPQLLEHEYTIEKNEDEFSRWEQYVDVQVDDEEYYSFDENEQQLSYENESVGREVATSTKRNGKKKHMIDEATQVGDLDFETLELRAVLPFRHSRFQRFKSIRTDIDSNDIAKIDGSKYSIPAPFELINSRELERALTERKKAVQYPTITIVHAHPEIQIPISQPSAAELSPRRRRTKSMKVDRSKSLLKLQPLEITRIKHERTRSTQDEHSFSEDATTTTTVDDTDTAQSEDENTETDDTLTDFDAKSFVTSVETPVPDYLDVPSHYSHSGTVSYVERIDDNLIQSWKNDVEGLSLNVTLANQYLRIFESVKHMYKDLETTMRHISFIKEKTALTLCNLNFVHVPLILIEAELLTVLDLSHNYLTSLPSWFCELKNLTTLALNHNLLTELPEKFSELKKLRELDLSYNKFEYMPSSVLHLISLVTLDISHNNILLIPAGIARLRHTLTELNFSYNNIIDIPDEVRALRKLRYAKFSENNLLYSSNLVLSKLSVEEIKSKKSIRQRSQTGLLANLYYLLGGQDDEAMSALRNDIASNTLNEIPTNAIAKLDLISSEIRYVKYLNILHEVFFVPLTTASILEDLKKEYEFSLSSSYLNIILPADIYAIIEFSRTFLISLMERMPSWESNPFSLKGAQIATLFLENIESFRSLYGTYPVVYDKAVDFLRELQRVNPEFDRFLKSRGKLPILDGMSLEGLLALPIQKIPKYHKCLLQLFKNTREDHPDYANIRKALKKMRELEEIHDKNVFIINNKYKILELQRKLKLTDLLIPNRFLLKDGKLTLAQTKGLNNFKKDVLKQIYARNSVMESVKELNPYLESLKSRLSRDDLWEVRLAEMTVQVFLFSDIILIKETNLIQKLVGKLNIYNLKGAYITDNPDNDKEFTLFIAHTNGTKLFNFICESVKDKTQWYNAINETITLLNPQKDVDDDDAGLEERATEHHKMLDHAYQHHEYSPLMEEDHEASDMTSPRTTGVTPNTDTPTKNTSASTSTSTIPSPSTTTTVQPETFSTAVDQEPVQSIEIKRSKSYASRIRTKDDTFGMSRAASVQTLRKDEPLPTADRSRSNSAV